MADSSSQLNRTPNPPLPSRPSQTKMSPQDYLFLRILGEGSFSTVYLTENIHSHDKYAIKVMYKAKILREKKSQYVKRERDALARCNHPFIVQLFCTFQDEEKLYFALTYCKYGELLNFLKKNGSFDLPCSKFYSAEMVCAIEYLHSKDIIHRDLKPENILLDTGMHIRITDFGSARILDEPAPTSPPQPSSDSDTPPMRSRTRSFVGTAQYVSPEMLQGRANHKSSDLWALGCIVFQMISGLMPFWGSHFFHSTEYAIFQKILKLDYEIPTGFEPVAKDLIQKLLVLDPTQRLGCEECGGFATLKSHPFYSGIDWDHLPTSTPPKLMPYLPATDDSPELHSFYEVPENIEPGLDDKQMTRLLGLEVCDFSHVRERKESLSTKLPYLQKKRLLDEQAQQCQFHKFVSGNLILKQGLVEKRKGLFSRKRMLLLTEGPHLYYVDPNAMVLKGEIPWSKELRPEPKNFKVFFVHTPKRTYYLEDPEGFALEWCKKIEEVRLDFFGSDTKP